MSKSYQYAAKNRDGKILKGVLEAEDETAAAYSLTEQGYYITELKPVKNLADYFRLTPSPVSSRDLSLYFRNISTMMEAGLPMRQTLQIIAKQSPTKPLKNATLQIISDLERGSSLSSAMAKQKHIFPNIAVSMVEAGEAGSALEESIKNLSIYFQKESDLRSTVISAILYPSIVSGFALIVLFVLLTFVLPNFAKMFIDIGVALPPLTKFLLDMSAFFKDNIFLLVVLVLILFLLVKIYFRTHSGRRTKDLILIKLPVLGNFRLKIATSRFCRTLGTLVKTNVPILQALEIVAKISDNVIISEEVKKASKAIEEGESISAPLAAGNLFPPMVTQLISIGEESGTLDSMLAKISDIYDEEIDRSVKRLASVLEPVIIIFLSVVVGIILLSVIIPMFDIITRAPA